MMFQNAMNKLRFAGGALLCAVVTGCSGTDPMIENVEAFRSAREAGNYAVAQSYLSSDPRVWYEKREGEGFPVKMGAGRYKAWDDHFRSEGDIAPWTAEGRTVWAIATEMNDYYRLIEREDESRYRITYFFDDAGTIEGYMISDPYAGEPSAPSVSRIDEIEAWALANDPDEWEYLRPGGSLDPTGDRAPRTRVLINKWRQEVGLEPIE